MRCGVTGLRPTFGRVPRTGAMTLCWSLDKLGPMARGVEDTLLVLKAISGRDRGRRSPACPASWTSMRPRLSRPARRLLSRVDEGELRPPMSTGPRLRLSSTGHDARRGGLPDWPYDSLQLILFAEAAAAFEELTLSGGDHELKMQVPDAWPNSFRQSRFLSAVDFVQADRLRRKVALEMARIMAQVDLLLVPSLRDEMLTITNFTGHPSLTLRAGFVEVSEARSDWAPDPSRPAAEVLSATPGSAWRHADRAAI